jgi:hypothetical protein
MLQSHIWIFAILCDTGPGVLFEVYKMFHLLQPSHISASVENWSDNCPVCCMTNFKSNQEMVAHIEEHFNQKGHRVKSNM